jgi:hypothetical protein
MEIRDNYSNEKIKRAKKRVDELKGFYIHFTVYLAVNTFISTMKVVRDIGDGASFGDAFWDFGTFAVWFFWGMGVVFHALNAFSYNPFFGKDWEERQIQKYLERDRKEAEKYK